MKIELKSLDNTHELKTLDDAQQLFIIQALDNLLAKKKEAAEKGDNEHANNYWRELEALKLNILFIAAFSKIKDHKYRAAWHKLERCEIGAKVIEENSTDEFSSKSRTRFIKEKVAKWQSLYPYCVFISPGFTARYKCSVCGQKIKPRSRCKHIKGKVYNGDLCVHIAYDMEFKEVSIVPNPVQKYSVLHNDETLDFSLINYLSDLLDNAFEEWNINWTKKSFPIERFSKVEPTAKCPCKSGKLFEECCITRDVVEIPHVEFLLLKSIPEDKSRIHFPY